VGLVRRRVHDDGRRAAHVVHQIAVKHPRIQKTQLERSEWPVVARTAAAVAAAAVKVTDGVVVKVNVVAVVALEPLVAMSWIMPIADGDIRSADVHPCSGGVAV